MKTLEQLIAEINKAGYRVSLFQYEKKERWDAECRPNGSMYSNYVRFGETALEALSKVAEDIKLKKPANVDDALAALG